MISILQPLFVQLVMFKSAKSLGFLTVVAFAALACFAGEAKAETFTIGGKSLNTNNGFRRIDGQPRLSIYTQTAGDPDQDFQRLPGNKGGVLLKHKSTGKCLNAHYLANGREINVWNCDANDPDQNWNVNPLGGNVVQIKRAGTNLCIDTPTRNNVGVVHLWACDSNNANQRWQSNNVSQPKPVTTQSQATASDYEVWLVARKPEYSVTDWTGHAWIAVVRKDFIVTSKYTNGRLTSQTRKENGGWKVDTTFGFWPKSSSFDFWSGSWQSKGPIPNQPNDKADTEKLINGQSISSRGYAVRKSKISKSRAEWIMKDAAYSQSGCYFYVGFGGTNGECNCADYATRLWHVLSSKRDDFRIRSVTMNLTLDSLVDKINAKNSDGGFLDGGRTWQ